MPITKLDINGPATRAQLDRIEKEHESNVQADVTLEGVEAEVSTEKKGFSIAAYVKRKWNGETSAGARIKKSF